MPVTEQQVRDKLRECYDPELPCNIVDLGLVYDIVISPLSGEKSQVRVRMTLTTPERPLASQIAGQVRGKVLEVAGVGAVAVELVFEPRWDPSRVSAEARQRLRLG
jgi:metal-sulfur cluster biosynthetic enzyme